MRTRPGNQHPSADSRGAHPSGILDDVVRESEQHAPVAQWIEHLTTDQKVRGSSPFGRALC